MTTNLYIIRYTELPFIFGQERTRKLSAEGEQDAIKVTKLMVSEEVDVAVSSLFARAIQTIEEIASTRGLEIDFCMRKWTKNK